MKLDKLPLEQRQQQKNKRKKKKKKEQSKVKEYNRVQHNNNFVLEYVMDNL